jgi:penicillin-binding protein 1A
MMPFCLKIWRKRRDWMIKGQQMIHVGYPLNPTPIPAVVELTPSFHPALKLPVVFTKSQESAMSSTDSRQSKQSLNSQETPSDSSQPSPQKPQKPRKRFYERWWVWITLGLVIGGVGTTYVTVRRSIVAIQRDLPDVSDIRTYARNGTITIKAEGGETLQLLGPATRDKVAYDQIPPLLADAFIASEDKNFYEHGGVDYQAIVRAMRTNLEAGEVVEGGSTITQQLARIVFLDQERSYERKLKEALLAQKIEQELTKEQILESYLNLVYLGSGAYGVADAAWVYFSKTVDELTLSEMATIAGLPPAPSVYSPLVNPDLALSRRNLVLERMVDAGFITSEEMEAAIAEPLNLNPSTPKYLYSEIPYFTTYVQQQLPNYVSPEELERGGLVIETTLNLDWQKAAEETVQNAITEYGAYEGFEQAALVCIDPRTGEIKAMVGGNDFNESQFNRVTQAQRQPGSTFKTIVYTAAIAAGFSPNKVYEDARFVIDGYEPQNYGRTFRGSVTIRDALISSINVVAVKTLIDVGFQPVVDLAHRMGIQSDLYESYSMALGASEVNLLELTSAYGTLAANGRHVEPHGIVRITNRYGDVLYEADFDTTQAVDADTAAIVTWMLQGVVQSGTGVQAQLGRPVAGKTGTSEERRDLWFIGYIPQLVTGVWLGNDDSRPTWGYSGTAALTWHDFMSRIVQDLPVEEFPALPALEGRTPTIQAQPVRPGRQTTTASNTDSNSTSESQSESGDNPEAPSPIEASAPSSPDVSPAAAEDSGRGRDRGDRNGDAEPAESPVAEDAPPVEEAPPEELPPPDPDPVQELPPPSNEAPVPAPEVVPVDPGPAPAPL